MMWRWCQKSNMRKQWARGCFVTYESKYRTYRGSSNVRWIWDTMTNGIIGTTGRWCWIHHESVQLATAKESLFNFCFAAGWSWLVHSAGNTWKWKGKMNVSKKEEISRMCWYAHNNKNTLRRRRKNLYKKTWVIFLAKQVTKQKNKKHFWRWSCSCWFWAPFLNICSDNALGIIQILSRNTILIYHQSHKSYFFRNIK